MPASSVEACCWFMGREGDKNSRKGYGKWGGKEDRNG